MVKSFAEINEKIQRGTAVVVTAEEIIDLINDRGFEETLREVDVVTTATFAPMCSSGMFVNFGHADPPIRMTKVLLNDVPAYSGIAAVDAYIGATELSDGAGMEYGGAHVIEDLVAGKAVRLRATGYATDCYPRTEIETVITKDSLNQAYMFNPRNAYQNYAAAINSSTKTLYTYMGTLLPDMGNVTYCSAGELSPLLNDPYYRTIGVGTRIFLGGAVGYVAWQGTQHNPCQNRAPNGVPVSGAGTLAVIGDIKDMSCKFVRAATFPNYGVTLYVGIGVPIPILDAEMLRFVAVSNRDIYTTVYDYSVPRRDRPKVARVSYAELRSGVVQIDGKDVPTTPISSLATAREIAQELKQWITAGCFLLQEPINPLPQHALYHNLEVED